MQKIYTRRGDKGRTEVGGKGVDKSDSITEALGALDELNSWVGVLRGKLHIKNTEGRMMTKELKRVQTNLFVINSVLAGSPRKIGAGEVRHLERIIDKLTEELPALKNFIYPVGEIQLVRAVCRRAERVTVRLMNIDSRLMNKVVLKYLNRLSDALFIMGRWINHRMQTEEEVWK